MAEKTRVNFVKIIFESLLMAVFASLVTIAIGWFTNPDLSVNISTPMYINGSYKSTIDIKNFSSYKTQKEVVLFFLDDCKIMDYEKDESNSIMLANNSIKIQDIAPTSSIALTVITNVPINKTRLKISCSARPVTNFLSEQSKFSNYLVITLSMNFIVILLSYGLVNYLSEKRWNQRIEEKKDLENIWKRNDEQLKKRLDMAEQQVLESLKTQNETQLFYAARFSDYSRELAFWKDTIRKLLYTYGESKNDADKFFDAITDSLKTYTTKKIDKQDYRVINYIARRIAERQSIENKPKE